MSHLLMYIKFFKIQREKMFSVIFSSLRTDSLGCEPLLYCFAKIFIVEFTLRILFVWQAIVCVLYIKIYSFTYE